MPKTCALAFNQNTITVATSGLLRPVTSKIELASFVQKNNLRQISTIGILSAENYQLLRVKRPDVAEKEMSNAILWQEQAKFSLPMDQLIVDYIDSPTLTNEKRLYVVAVAKRVVRDCYETLMKASLRPHKITVPEFVYGQYIQRYYRTEKMVIWVNYLQDVAQAFAFYQGELIATLRLPKIEAAILSAACVNALNMFYLSEIKSFSDAPLWLINGLCALDATLIAQMTGKVVELRTTFQAEYQQALASEHPATVSHAYYGVLANE